MMMPARPSTWTWFHAALVFLGHYSSAHLLGRDDIREAPLIKTRFGIVKGAYINNTNVIGYRGIPYAQPPVGDLRFEPPRPIEPPSNANSVEIDATKYRPRCIQHSLDFVLPVPLDASQENEDCLTVNVFVPQAALANKKPLPVFVWVYGGGFLEGYSSAYDPTGILNEFPEMIVVTFNYRLTLFGNPNSRAIGSEGSNPGLRDQQLAFQWVRDNIDKFGGVPWQITFGGYSAGSGSVLTYFYANPNQTIAKGAWLFSGTASTFGPRDPSEFERVAAAVECRDAANPEAELACMKTIDAGRLKKAISPLERNVYGFPFVAQNGGIPGVDNVTAFDAATVAQRAQVGNFSRVPVVIGDVEHELDGLMPWTPRGINHTASDLLTSTFFHCPTAEEASARSKYGRAIWRFRYQGTFPSFRTYPWLRSFHGQDVTLLFEGHLRPDTERAAASYLRSALVAFVKDPQNGLSRFGWPRYKSDALTLVNLFRDNDPKNPTRISSPREADIACGRARPPPIEALLIRPPPCDPCFD